MAHKSETVGADFFTTGGGLEKGETQYSSEEIKERAAIFSRVQSLVRAHERHPDETGDPLQLLAEKMNLQLEEIEDHKINLSAKQQVLIERTLSKITDWRQAKEGFTQAAEAATDIQFGEEHAGSVDPRAIQAAEERVSRVDEVVKLAKESFTMEEIRLVGQLLEEQAPAA